MSHFGCGAILQFTVLVMLMFSGMCAITGMYNDMSWVFELERIKGVFSDEEVELLRRYGQYLHVPYVLIHFSLYTLVIIHIWCCFEFQKKRFHKSNLSRVIVLVIGVSLITMGFYLTAITLIQDRKYKKMENIDKREYVYTSRTANGSEYQTASYSIFYYCHFASGYPVHWSRLKGIRMKKYGSNICHQAGILLISAILEVYSGFLYLLTLTVLDSNRRDKSAAHVALIFDLFGDLEESKYKEISTENHYHGDEIDLEAYKRDLIQHSFKDTKLPPKIEKWLKTGKYEQDSVDALQKGMKEIPTPNVYRLSPYTDENRDLPIYLQNIAEDIIDEKSEADDGSVILDHIQEVSTEKMRKRMGHRFYVKSTANNPKARKHGRF